MAGESDDLDKLFESVADGESVDWDALERAAPDDDARAVIRQLRLIAEVAEVHRSQVDEVADGEEAAPIAAAAGADGLPIRVPEGRQAGPDISTTSGVATDGSVLPRGAPPPSDLGVWGHLLLVRKIGEGSFGEVYQAHDTWLDHPVALKLLRPEAEGRVPPAQLLHEARKLVLVRHVNVVTVHGAARHNGRVGFWMDFIDGETLSVRVQQGRLSAGEAVSVGQEVCRALAAVHQAKLIHRDVKAQNVMRAYDGGRIILMDFGAGEFVGDALNPRAQGTPLYMAPEIFRGEGASVRSDIYAAGVLLYYLVTDSYPVEGASFEAIRQAHERGERRRLRDERPDLPESFIAIVERAIDPNPLRRYVSAGEMEAKLSGEPSTKPVDLVLPPTPTPDPLPPPPPILKRAGVALAVLFASTIVCGFVAVRVFDVTLRVNRDFSLGVADTFAVGVTVMIPFIAMWLVGAAVLAALIGGALLLRGYWSSSLERLMAFCNARDPTMTAAVIVVSTVAWWATLNLVLFAAPYTALLDLWGNPATADVSLLASANRSLYTDHYLASAYSSMLLGLIVWRWFPALERRSGASSAIRFWKWLAVAVAFSFVAWTGAPRRLVLERYPVVEFDNRSGLVIGSAGNELLVYAPEEPGRPRRRMRSDAPGLQRTGDSRFLFDPGQTNSPGQ